MEITFTLNGKKVTPQIDADTLLIDLVRDLGCYSVKRGCETSNCGLCTVFMDDQPILSCSILAARVDGHKIDTLEGLQEEAAEFGAFIANQGAEQCGSGISLNNAIAFMIIPGLQNPHCSAPWFAIKAPNSAASSCSPSKVSILCPSTLAARMEQIKDDEGRRKLADEVTGQMNFGSNMRGSAAYREQLSKVLLRRGF